LLELIVPEQFEVKKGKWSFTNLPVIPPHFDLQPIERNENRLKVLKKLIKRDDVTEHLQKLNMQPIGGKPDDIRKFIADETARWGEVIRAAGITAN